MDFDFKKKSRHQNVPVGSEIPNIILLFQNNKPFVRSLDHKVLFLGHFEEKSPSVMSLASTSAGD